MQQIFTGQRQSYSNAQLFELLNDRIITNVQLKAAFGELDYVKFATKENLVDLLYGIGFVGFRRARASGVEFVITNAEPGPRILYTAFEYIIHDAYAQCRQGRERKGSRPRHTGRGAPGVQAGSLLARKGRLGEAIIELKRAVETGFALSFWCGSADCEAKIKEETRATMRCIPLEQEGENGTCVCCGQPATARAIFARAY